MDLPVPVSQPIVIREEKYTDDFAEFARVLAHQGSSTVVYAPTTVVHQHSAPAPAVTAVPYPGTSNHPGFGVDLTGYGAAFEPPRFVAPLPAVPERRSLAPLAFLLCGWSTIAAALTTAMTGGNPAAIGATFAAMAGAGASFAVIYRGQA